MPKNPPYLHLKRSALPASVRLSRDSAVLDEIADPQVQVAVWRPNWTATARRAMQSLTLAQLPSQLPKRARWHHDDECDVYSFVHTLRRHRAADPATLWQEVLPQVPGYDEIAAKLAVLTQAVMRHSPARAFELLSSPGYYGGQQPDVGEAERPRMLHLDAQKLKGFANLVGATTIGCPAAPGSHELGCMNVPMRGRFNRCFSLPPHSLAIWKGEAGDYPFHHDWPALPQERQVRQIASISPL